MTFKTLRDFDLTGKRVLLRADLNVPAKDGVVTDATRIDRLKPTINALVKAGAKILLLSHFGRPKGGPDVAFSLRFLQPILQQRWGVPVSFAPDCIGDTAKAAAHSLQNGQVLLLENVRFHAGEEKNDAAFTRALAELGDIFVHDAFSAAHRAHASTEGLAHVLPSAAGLLMEEELQALANALENPARPVAALVGGAKISTKLDLLNNLIKKVDVLVLGGGMANTFLYAQGYDLGKSLCEKDMKDTAQNILAQAQKLGCTIVLPTDLNCAPAFAAGQQAQTCAATAMPNDLMALDIGPKSAQAIIEKLKTCKTVVWNGPLGAFEIPPFNTGTVAVAQAVAQLTVDGKLLSVGGGGDTVAALEAAGVSARFSYISTAGGAFLEWLEGKDLPGVAALNKTARAA